MQISLITSICDFSTTASGILFVNFHYSSEKCTHSKEWSVLKYLLLQASVLSVRKGEISESVQRELVQLAIVEVHGRKYLQS